MPFPRLLSNEPSRSSFIPLKNYIIVSHFRAEESGSERPEVMERSVRVSGLDWNPV